MKRFAFWVAAFALAAALPSAAAYAQWGGQPNCYARNVGLDLDTMYMDATTPFSNTAAPCCTHKDAHLHVGISWDCDNNALTPKCSLCLYSILFRYAGCGIWPWWAQTAPIETTSGACNSTDNENEFDLDWTNLVGGTGQAYQSKSYYKVKVASNDCDDLSSGYVMFAYHTFYLP